MTDELNRPTHTEPEQDSGEAASLSPAESDSAAPGADPQIAELDRQIAATDASLTETEDLPPEDTVTAGENPLAEDALPLEHERHVRAPLVIATVLVLLTVAVILVWSGFFYKSLKGVWKYRVTVGEDDTAADYTYNLSFEDDHVCRYNVGGITYKGKYKTEQQEGKEVVTMTFTQMGTEVFRKSFTYETEGNVFAKRQLLVTDLDGMILPPDVLGEEVESEVNMKKKLAGSKEEDGKRYYIIPFQEIPELTPRTKAYEDGKTDSILTGTWYEANENSGYGYTFTFREDGTYELLYSDISYSGCYTAENGVCSYNLLSIDGQEMTNEMTYSMKDDKLILEVGGQQSELVRTDNRYAFEGAIK